MTTFFRQYRWWILGTAVVALFVAKFLWPLVAFDTPLGYDPGIYRKLFVSHAKGWPPFFVADLPRWGYYHPFGLFTITTPLLRLGMPVDWLMGWIWNTTVICLGLSLAWITYRRKGLAVGIATLFLLLLSESFYDGFWAMYWKTIVALLFFIWSVYAMEKGQKKVWLTTILGIATVATHHQTGLIFCLSIGTMWLLWSRKHYKEKVWKRVTLIGTTAIIAVGLFYLQNWKDTILTNIPVLLSSLNSAQYGGSFPDLSYYVQYSGLLLLCGLAGLVWDIYTTRRLTMWSLAALWSAVFVFGRLFFYKRFYLQLDFFLIPFAASFLVHLWNATQKILWQRIVLIILITVQVLVAVDTWKDNYPLVRKENIDAIRALEDIVDPEGYIIVVDHLTAPWVVGWLPEQKYVGGPGFFDDLIRPEKWKEFFEGTHEERIAIMKRLPKPTYVYLTQEWMQQAPAITTAFIQDSCLQPIPYTPLVLVTCQ